jgi:hypothetical protein
MKKETISPEGYAYYSRVLKEVFDSPKELLEAEEAYYAKQKAKEEKAAVKKADAVKVEEAFKALNNARKEYKEQITLVAENYGKELKELKAAFEEAKELVEKRLAYAENKYSDALKDFNDKYPEGYHITLKDGDFETTISRNDESTPKVLDSSLHDLFDLLFNFQ